MAGYLAQIINSTKLLVARCVQATDRDGSSVQAEFDLGFDAMAIGSDRSPDPHAKAHA